MHLRIRDIQQLLEMSMLFLTILQLLPGPSQILISSHSRDFVLGQRRSLYRFQNEMLSILMLANQPSQLLCEEL
jgi:hypothetical protein